jgi:hypothetical protein
MTPDDRQQMTAERFAHWTQQLDRVQATPFIVIGIGHADHEFHVCVPHHDVPETALMVKVLRKIANDLEALGPEER